MTSRSILVVTGLTREAKIVSGPGLVALAGGGAKGLFERIEAAIARERPAALVSFGLAGALAKGLEPGDLVVGSAVIVGGERFECDGAWRGRIVALLGSGSVEASAAGSRISGRGARPRAGRWPDPGAPYVRDDELDGTVVLASERMVTEAAAKHALHAETGAAIVDMESAAVAHAAAAHGLPFAVIRAVSDSAAQSLPSAVLNGMKPDGGMDLGGVLASLARDPRQLPALIRTGLEAERGFKALKQAALRLGRSAALGF